MILFCLVPARALAATLLGELVKELGANVKVHPIDLAGRERRASGAQSLAMEEAVTDAVAIIERESKGSPWALLGHSTGGLIAYEIGRALTTRNRRLPERIIVWGCLPPRPLRGSRSAARCPSSWVGTTP